MDDTEPKADAGGDDEGRAARARKLILQAVGEVSTQVTEIAAKANGDGGGIESLTKAQAALIEAYHQVGLA